MPARVVPFIEITADEVAPTSNNTNLLVLLELVISQFTEITEAAYAGLIISEFGNSIDKAQSIPSGGLTFSCDGNAVSASGDNQTAK